jgi:hypothetical protein
MGRKYITDSIYKPWVKKDEGNKEALEDAKIIEKSVDSQSNLALEKHGKNQRVFPDTPMF